MNDLASLGVITLYLALVNAWAAGLVWWDKRQAGWGRRRIRERTLFLSAFAGGFIGGIWAMRGLRHKTLKTSFIWRFALATLANLSLWAVAAWLAV
ncbi:MAG TPA: DUF1294 domain-containing protein [Dehalococcoidia bacterium]|jgi:uncharacterized membrane protein YsdA (DUF1294 family)|nr:hypothetical protein [Chloroflexota bacterium]MDP5877617.1 DUF1294 domain-containing protein [Dehalococcoidia bacterium]MDP6274533.1 DUF1294 domain-containing protein [Dehalococcoidia bacterium]MDP7159702.1 DUF1294 domain-containing protein [Dehalococcoidia bacterium]MDP7212838.1 DUF1294 domain-containing protein [Dehalococcoidia bacterium]|tara:strand:- start:1389 stop:1676 length:288 start_codon:yes stop_codon:yes gene_type:complete